MNIPLNVRYYMAEFYGTFMLFFLGIGAILLTGNALIGALAFGAAYLISAMTLMHISHAHFNPVITLAAWLDGRMEMKTLWVYVFGQLTGALFGVLSLLLFTNVVFEGIPYQVFSLPVYILEVFFAFVVVYVYLAVSEQPDRRPFLGLAVGASYALVFLLAARMQNGGVIHPLRFFESLIFNGSFNIGAILLTWFSLEVGGLLAAFFYKYLKFNPTPIK